MELKEEYEGYGGGGGGGMVIFPHQMPNIITSGTTTSGTSTIAGTVVSQPYPFNPITFPGMAQSNAVPENHFFELVWKDSGGVDLCATYQRHFKEDPYDNGAAAYFRIVEEMMNLYDAVHVGMVLANGRMMDLSLRQEILNEMRKRGDELRYKQAERDRLEQRLEQKEKKREGRVPQMDIDQQVMDRMKNIYNGAIK